MTIALTTIAAISLVTLVYIAIAITGTYTTQNISPGSTNTSLAEPVDSAVNHQIATSLDYVHKSDINVAPVTIPLHGVNLSANQFLLLYAKDI